MNNFKESLKVSIEPDQENRNITLIKQYLNKEKELSRIFDEEDGVDINAEDYEPKAEITLMRIMNLLSYREIRTKQAYTSKICKGDNSRSTREMLSKLDKDRRDSHNLALESFKWLMDFAKKYNLEPLYTGPMLSEKEIEAHKPESYDARQEMTDAFLQILKDLGDYSTRNCSDRGLKKDIESIQDRMYKISRDYGVKEELLHDDGDVLFKDFENEISQF